MSQQEAFSFGTVDGAKDLLGTLSGMFGDAGSRIRVTFECMAIAERLLAASRIPKNKQPFLALCPTESICRVPILYEAHAWEIIRRAKRGEDLRPGTKAEVLAALLEASEVAPPKPWYGALANELFAELLPKLSAKIETPSIWGYQYDGQRDEILRECRNATKQPERKGAE